MPKAAQKSLMAVMEVIVYDPLIRSKVIGGGGLPQLQKQETTMREAGQSSGRNVNNCTSFTFVVDLEITDIFGLG